MKQSNRKPYLDMIRAFSVCMIVLYHFCGPIKVEGTEKMLFHGFANGNWGDVSVFLFFMISGRGLFIKYQQELELKEYIKNRIGKIMVPFWIWYTIAFLYFLWKD